MDGSILIPTLLVILAVTLGSVHSHRKGRQRAHVDQDYQDLFKKSYGGTE